jgi:hypothetical protein
VPLPLFRPRSLKKEVSDFISVHAKKPLFPENLILHIVVVVITISQRVPSCESSSAVPLIFHCPFHFSLVCYFMDSIAVNLTEEPEVSDSTGSSSPEDRSQGLMPSST